MNYLMEISLFPSSTSTDQELIRELSSEPVAYLRDADISLLYPIYGNYRLRKDVSHQKGSALEFLWKLHADLIKQGKRMTPELKNEIYLMEIRRHLLNKRKEDLAKSIKSLEDCDKIPREFLRTFRKERWYFNQIVSHDSLDEYQLLCLGHELQNGWDEPISGIDELNNVGNSLKADLQYKKFSDMVFKELQWDDTEEQGVKKAIFIRDKYFPDMKDSVIAWLLDDLAGHFQLLYSYWKNINMYWKMWVRVVEKQEPLSHVASDLTGQPSNEFICTEFLRIKKYIDTWRNGLNKRVQGLIIRYFNIRTGGAKRIGGIYVLYVKEKIRMALQLGIIRKEDVMESDAGSEILKDIDQYNPHLFVDYHPRFY